MLHLILTIDCENRSKSAAINCSQDCLILQLWAWGFALLLVLPSTSLSWRWDAQLQDHTAFAWQMLILALTLCASQVSPWEGDRAGNHNHCQSLGERGLSRYLLLALPLQPYPGGNSRRGDTTRKARDGRMSFISNSWHTQTHSWTDLQQSLGLCSGSYFLTQKHLLKTTAELLRNLPAWLIFHLPHETMPF